MSKPTTFNLFTPVADEDVAIRAEAAIKEKYGADADKWCKHVLTCKTPLEITRHVYQRPMEFRAHQECVSIYCPRCGLELAYTSFMDHLDAYSDRMLIDCVHRLNNHLQGLVDYIKLTRPHVATALRSEFDDVLLNRFCNSAAIRKYERYDRFRDRQNV